MNKTMSKKQPSKSPNKPAVTETANSEPANETANLETAHTEQDLSGTGQAGPADPAAETEAPSTEQVATSAKAPPTELVLELPFRAESPAFLEVLIEGQVKWLRKTALKAWEPREGKKVAVTMSRKFALRRKLVKAAA